MAQGVLGTPGPAEGAHRALQAPKFTAEKAVDAAQGSQARGRAQGKDRTAEEVLIRAITAYRHPQPKRGSTAK